jgi:hypothetical protein
VAVQLLKLDPRRVSLRAVLGQDPVIGLAPVHDIAHRHDAVAAVNAGFFEPGGEPAGLLKVAGDLVGDATRQRGAVALMGPTPAAPVRLLFDRVSVAVSIRFRVRGATHVIPIAGVDAGRRGPGLILYSRRYGPVSGTDASGTDWVLEGSPLTVRSRHGQGETPIPAGGFVLSFAGADLPPELRRLEPGVRVEVRHDYRTWFGTSPRDWQAAPDVIGGAGLLVLKGRAITDWTRERFGTTFDVERHPRTMIGTDRDGAIWLVTVDGRQPALSLGMTFRELQSLARRLRLQAALNLDGGGSATMVVRGRIVNHPSDPTGPRPVSDAILVFDRS